MEKHNFEHPSVKMLLMFHHLIILISSCFLITACNTQKEQESSLLVTIALADSTYGRFLFPDSVTILKNDTLLSKWSPSTKKADTLLQNVGSGRYTFRYKNLLGQHVDKAISINHSRKEKLTLFIDYTDYKKNIGKSWVSQLKPNEKINLTFNSQGCFHVRNDTIILTKSTADYYLQYKNEKIKLSKEDLDYLIKFECELPLIPNNGYCTSTDTFAIQYGTLKKEYEDGDCNWNGYYRLFQRFGLTERN